MATKAAHTHTNIAGKLKSIITNKVCLTPDHKIIRISSIVFHWAQIFHGNLPSMQVEKNILLEYITPLKIECEWVKYRFFGAIVIFSRRRVRVHVCVCVVLRVCVVCFVIWFFDVVVLKVGRSQLWRWRQQPWINACPKGGAYVRKEAYGPMFVLGCCHPRWPTAIIIAALMRLWCNAREYCGVPFVWEAQKTMTAIRTRL